MRKENFRVKVGVPTLALLRTGAERQGGINLLAEFRRW